MSKKAVIEVTPQVHRRVSVRAKKAGISRKSLVCSLLTNGLDRVESGEIKIDSNVIATANESANTEKP